MRGKDELGSGGVCEGRRCKLPLGREVRRKFGNIMGLEKVAHAAVEHQDAWGRRACHDRGNLALAGFRTNPNLGTQTNGPSHCYENSKEFPVTVFKPFTL